tara:strand:+ start:689 stop:862 length:174 start_codon:yes stop_codon:yes gene_type:complete
MKPKKTKKPVEMEMGGEIMVEDSKMMKKKTKRMRGGGMVQKMRMGGKVGKSCAVRGA